MKKETSSKLLNVFGWLDIIGGVLILILAVFAFTSINNDVINEAIKTANITIPDGTNISPSTLIGIALTTTALVTLLEGYLLRRASKDGSKSTLILVLTILSVVAGGYGLIRAFSISSLISVLFDVFVLYLLFNVRKEN